MFLPLGSMLGAEATISNSRLVIVIEPVMRKNCASTGCFFNWSPHRLSNYQIPWKRHGNSSQCLGKLGNEGVPA